MQQQSSVQESPILTTPPPRKHPSIVDESIVAATPDTPKQPTPKRARLSLNRLQAIRDEEVAQNLALLRSPTLNAPVPKLSARVGAKQKKVSLTSENEKQGRLHSTPVKIDMTLNFTFGLQNISAINSSSTEQTSPRSRTSNITFRRRKTSSTSTRGPR
uniref:Condensin complex subunit 1 C-terminal domain-containing protein n=1 Tax=Panagrolaimus sp. PS1159 TaxID=55785 RepID=A0AC35G3X4_9BILA